MSPALIRLLTLCLLALIYLFFIRVLYAVWTEVRPPRAPRVRRGRAPRSSAAPGRLGIVAPESAVGQVFTIADELTIGRAAGCEVTIDDGYASQMHARVFRRDDQVLVEDLGSTNSTYLNREKVNRPTVVNRGDVLQIGATVFEVMA
jgi:pSer/pThr/pTyr-binding forkhead associated (FHA) protein